MTRSQGGITTPRLLTVPLLILLLDFDCNGNLIETAPVKLNSAGGRLDIIEDRVRVSGFAGEISSDAKRSNSAKYDGIFGGGLVAYEWNPVGLGAGIVHVDGPDGFTLPSLYVRGGSINTAHLRLEFLLPSEVFGNMAWVRIGVGFNQGSAPGTRGFFGLGAMPYTYSERWEPRAVGEYDLPISQGLDLLFRGQVSTGANHVQWGTGVGLGIRMGWDR